MWYGFVMCIDNISLLDEEQQASLRREMGVLAVSRRPFEDPIEAREQGWKAHYRSAYHAQETVQHIDRYLEQIGRKGQLTVSLEPAQWKRRDDGDAPAGRAHCAYVREQSG